MKPLVAIRLQPFPNASLEELTISQILRASYPRCSSACRCLRRQVTSPGGQLIRSCARSSTASSIDCRQAQAEQYEERTSGPGKAGKRARMPDKGGANTRSGHGQDQAPQRPRGDKGKTEDEKCADLRRAVGVDELRKQRQEEQRDLGIEHVGHYASAEGRTCSIPRSRCS